MNTVETLTKLNENITLAEKIKKECKTPELVYEALKNIGLTDDFETFKAEAAKINEQITKMNETEVNASVRCAGNTITTVTTTTSVTAATTAAALAL